MLTKRLYELLTPDEKSAVDSDIAAFLTYAVRSRQAPIVRPSATVKRHQSSARLLAWIRANQPATAAGVVAALGLKRLTVRKQLARLEHDGVLTVAKWDYVGDSPHKSKFYGLAVAA